MLFRSKSVFDKKPKFLSKYFKTFTIPPLLGDTCIVGKQEYLADHLSAILRLFGVEFEEKVLLHTAVNVSQKYQTEELTDESQYFIKFMAQDIIDTFYSDKTFNSNSLRVFVG